MAAEAIMQFVPFLVAMLGIVWHQQHSTNRLEAKINRLDDKVEAKFNRVDDTLRTHGERLARIEAKLEIEPPAEAA